LALAQDATILDELWAILKSDRATELHNVLTREARPWLEQHSYIVVDAPAPQEIADQSRSFMKVDAAAQKFAQRWVDPLLDLSRDQQRKALSTTGEAPPVSGFEQEMNRRLLLSLAALGLAVSGDLFLAPLRIPALVLGIHTSWPAYVRAYRRVIQQRKIDMDLLGAVSLIGTWLGGFVTVGALACVLHFLTRKLISKTKDHSRQSLVDVFGKQARTVWMLVDGVEVEVPFERIRAGDILAVQAGQAVPADGVITHGAATIDQHTLTGEAQPIEKGVGDAVFATTVVLTGAIQLRVEKAGQDTTAAQITQILNRTANYQMAIESTALQLADRSVAPTLIASGLALPLVGYEGAVAITNAAFGFNIRMTGPVAMLNHLNIAARQGILVKDGRSLELLHKIDTVIFDKTGTLTLDQPQVTQVHLFNGVSKATLLAYAGAVERRQTHPIARAIVNAAQAQGLALPPINDARYEMGYGIQARIEDRLLRIGSDRFMELEGIPLPAEVARLKAAVHAQGHSLVMAALDGELAGAIQLEPTIRPEAPAIIADLHRRGKRVYIISGDHEQPTRALAERLGIDDYFANTLPEQKADHVARLQAEGRTVCFVGDGINDSIALKKAQVSVSLRGATTVATDTAQVVLMDTTLNQLPALFNLTDEFNASMKTGFAMAMIPSGLIVGGVFLAQLGLVGSLLLYEAGVIAAMGTAMWPLYRHRAAFKRQPR
jgi:Cu2+-exporting ATPase